MSEAILKALIRLFAIIATIEQKIDINEGREIVKKFLKAQLNEELAEEYLKFFDEFYQQQIVKKSKKRLSADSVKVLALCSRINNELQQHQKIPVIVKLLEFVKYTENINPTILEFLKVVNDTFNIPNEEYENIKSFILGQPEEIANKNQLLIISGYELRNGFKNIVIKNLESKIYVLQISSVNLYIFKYVGNDQLSLNGQPINLNETYILLKGSTLRSPKISPIFYSDIVHSFLQKKFEERVSFIAKDVNFRFKNSNNGIHNLTIWAKSGDLVGIMGTSGAGKTTLMNILNGNIKPQNGVIKINNYDINKDKDKIEGLIGYVPQDDLLIEELTVYENLYYNAKLCLANLNDNEIKEIVNKTLLDLDLYDIKDLKVGNPLNKFISGGQRKRLNIALELIREPEILFVDEPTSGLSSIDAEMVMDLLKELTIKGKIIFVNIHQPSSEIFKLFDKILILDKGGYPVYFGNPIEAVIYFKKAANYVDADESECKCCGNVNPEIILKIIETRVVDEYGRLTNTRKFPPQKWHDAYLKNFKFNYTDYQEIQSLSFKKKFVRPNFFTQFKIFFIRDLLAKLSNKQYLIITLLEAPLLALILSYFTKYVENGIYIFLKNYNLFNYLFMCVVVALFFGLVISAEEIIKDRKILQREKFLNLSKSAYLHSKILILFFISAFQMLSFILVGNTILEIKELHLQYFLVLFSTACFANILGLNLSSALNSVVAVYITIPFILVPQLLLNGVVVKYDKLHEKITNYKYVPIIGDLITARWAYEALAVVQFKDNKWKKNFFNLETKKNFFEFKINYLIPELKEQVKETVFLKKNKKNINDKLTLIKNELIKLDNLFNKKCFLNIDKINSKNFDEKIANDILLCLESRLLLLKKELLKIEKEIDNVYDSLNKKFGQDKLIKLKENYHNESIENLVLNKYSLENYKIYKGEIIQVSKPIYVTPDSKIGRAHYFSAFKILGNFKVDTLWFNLMFIWFTSLILYVLLRFEVLRKIIESNIWNCLKKKRNED